MWAIRDFAGRYFSEGGWADRTRDALLYATFDEAERSMQENGIVDAHCIFTGGDGDWCQTCARRDPDQGKCPAFLDFTERYRHGSLECIDAIRAALTPEEFRGFCKGNVMKYVWRERHKGGDADLDKARDYVGYAVAGDDRGKL